jgi:hypothetical protein
MKFGMMKYHDYFMPIAVMQDVADTGFKILTGFKIQDAKLRNACLALTQAGESLRPRSIGAEARFTGKLE